MLLTGTFARSVDDKQRIALPKRLREVMHVSERSGLYIAPGTDGSLAIYTEEALAAMAARMTSVSPTQQDVRAFSRLFYAQAERVELDAQGRLRVPPNLVQLASLGKEAVLLGVQDHLELWDKVRWEAYLADRSSHYDEIAERAFAGPAAKSSA
jgi:MraZ protein